MANQPWYDGLSTDLRPEQYDRMLSEFNFVLHHMVRRKLVLKSTSCYGLTNYIHNQSQGKVDHIGSATMHMEDLFHQLTGSGYGWKDRQLVPLDDIIKWWTAGIAHVESLRDAGLESDTAEYELNES